MMNWIKLCFPTNYQKSENIESSISKNVKIKFKYQYKIKKRKH
jgi:hypothetical protein